jgi:ribosome biogenesis protein ERB1|tara:strand:- start:734 stop:988 length:255 start_codon:yes stop_codon:yes gene_type:complete
MANKDEVDKFLEKANDPTWWRKINDDLNNKEVKLSKGDLDMLKRIRKGKVANKDFKLNDENWYFEFESKDSIHPLSGHEPKRRF